MHLLPSSHSVRFHPSHLVSHETHEPLLTKSTWIEKIRTPSTTRPFTTSSTPTDLKKLRETRKEAYLCTYIQSHRPSSLRSHSKIHAPTSPIQALHHPQVKPFYTNTLTSFFFFPLLFSKNRK
ncbi:hypothetical protein HMI54_014191 [Coelomomyces lativittatus]|nr:hypothetical protein HMI54_014191 [Coelomomyces lativittatus]